MRLRRFCAEALSFTAGVFDLPDAGEAAGRSAARRENGRMARNRKKATTTAELFFMDPDFKFDPAAAFPRDTAAARTVPSKKT